MTSDAEDDFTGLGGRRRPSRRHGFGWLSIVVLVVGGGSALWAVRSRVESAGAHPALPAPATRHPTADPGETSTAVAYKLLRDNKTSLLEVVATDVTIEHMSPDRFDAWCIPFDASRQRIKHISLVARDGHLESRPEGGGLNWWSVDPYNLPSLRQEWIDELDDEKWYVCAVEALK